MEVMPQVNVRLSDQVIQDLDDLVARGLYKDRTTAIRAAIWLITKTEQQRAQGRRILALDEDAIKRLNIALELA